METLLQPDLALIVPLTPPGGHLFELQNQFSSGAHWK